MNPILEAIECLGALVVLYWLSLIAKRLHPHVARIRQATTPPPVTSRDEVYITVAANPRADMPGEES